MILKVIIILLLIALIYSLASAAFFMLKDKGEGKRLVRALTWRISIAVLIFALLFVGYYMGWITPNPGPLAYMNGG